MTGRYENKKKSSGRKKITLIVIGITLMLLIALVIAGAAYYTTMLNKINKVEVPKIVYTRPVTEATEGINEATTEMPEENTEMTVETTTATTAPHIASSADYLNVLVVGQAARGGEEERFADTMMLFTINTYEKSVTMTSFLRDSLVHPPEWNNRTFGWIKLTSVYHLGSYYGNGPASSMELMNLTLYNNFGVEVDYNFEVDFDAFIRVIDELGGVDIELTPAEADYLNADDFWVYKDVEPGMNTLDGMTALSYARMRKAEGDSDSDIVRTTRQRKLVESVIDKLKVQGPGFVSYVSNQVLPLITTSMSNSEITDLMLTLLPMLPDLTIKTGGTCPAESWGDMVDIFGDGVYHSVLHFDQTATTKTMRAITEGELQ